MGIIFSVLAGMIIGFYLFWDIKNFRNKNKEGEIKYYQDITEAAVKSFKYEMELSKQKMELDILQKEYEALKREKDRKQFMEDLQKYGICYIDLLNKIEKRRVENESMYFMR